MRLLLQKDNKFIKNIKR